MSTWTGRPTQADVARLAGVSRQTVSLVGLGDPRVSPEKRNAVEEAMAQLGYRPNAMARALAARRTSFVGIVLLDLGNPFLADIVEALRLECEAAGFIPFVSPVGEDAATEAITIDRFLQMNVDGLVIVSPVSQIEDLARVGTQVPTVLVTFNLPVPGVDVVHTDDAGGVEQMTNHLLDTGYDPIILLGYDQVTAGDSRIARQRGYDNAMLSAGQKTRFIAIDQTPIAAAVSMLVGEYRRGFGLMCHNDMIAIEAMGALRTFGLEPGRDVGVAGFDNTRISGNPLVSLTTVDQHTEAMGRQAIELLQERISGRTESETVVLDPILVPRESTRGRRQ